MDFSGALSKEFSLSLSQANNIIELLDSGNTVPFIARYRKEMTGSASDELLRDFSERLIYLRNVEKRRAEIIASIEEQDKMTDALRASILSAKILAELEDLYLPFRPKRRTRASIARERGLESLAKTIFAQGITTGDPLFIAGSYVNPEKEVETAEDALSGACDIIAEDIANNAAIRKLLREFLFQNGALSCTQAKEGPSVYEMYYDYEEPVKKAANHRILAVNRAEKEGFLKVAITFDKTVAISKMRPFVLSSNSIFTDLLESTMDDSFSRLLFPSLERDIRSFLTERASLAAIRQFGQNLRAVLMTPPVRGKTILAVDPAYRTGCKTAVIDDTGKLLAYTVIYPAAPQNKTEEAKAALTRLIEKHHVDIIAIGNGTASKETEIFVVSLIEGLKRPIVYAMVNEAGASVYSASKLASAEFPDLDVTLRSAVSIGRRLIDPLSELVKIDPKSIGVGLYQHDMPPAKLDESLDHVVEECVNTVGVELNTASAALLSHVAGVGPSLAKNIVAWREENGRFKQRKDLLKVSKLGPKAYTQCAGFLRIASGDNVLDNTCVHPESYKAAHSLLNFFSLSLNDKESFKKLSLLPAQIGGREEEIAKACQIGVPTLVDIAKELSRPGRDVRDALPPVELRSDLLSLENVKEGMLLSGTVRNVIDFGAFVDIGVHQDGLVHISQICDRFIRHPSEVLTPGDRVKVKVLSVSPDKGRISLTMKL